MILRKVAADLAPEFLPTVTAAIQEAYRENAPLQDPSLGHGEYTFAHTNSKTIPHLLKRWFEKSETIRVVPENNSQRYECGGRKFFIHKLGVSENDDPWASFPEHGGPAGRAADPANGSGSQLGLPMGLEELEAAVIVFGVYGSLKGGLRAIRLQAAGSVREERIESWTDVMDVWVASRDAGMPPDEPRPVDVEDPPLGLRRLAGESNHAVGG